MFRFHTGSIKRIHPYFDCRYIQIGFDSILVRLKGTQDALSLNAVGYQFRFHTGSIKRRTNHASHASIDGFRFHTGSIKSSFGSETIDNQACFDSILVRLKAYSHHDPKVVEEVSIPYWFD